MQITIVQSEIEEAIREYVGRKLTVANGMRMDIELRAGRGPEGFSATIDVQAAPVAAREQQQNPPASSTNGTRAMPLQAHREEQVHEEPAPEVERDIEPDANQEEQAETGIEASQATVEQSQTETPVAESTEAPPPGKKGRSLFGGLKKP